MKAAQSKSEALRQLLRILRLRRGKATDAAERERLDARIERVEALLALQQPEEADDD